MQWVAPEVEPGQKHSTNEDIFMRDGLCSDGKEVGAVLENHLK